MIRTHQLGDLQQQRQGSERPPWKALGLVSVFGFVLIFVAIVLGSSLWVLAFLPVLYAWIVVDWALRLRERHRWREPIRRLAEQAEALAEGRHSLDLPKVQEPELQALCRSIEDLRNQRLADAALRLPETLTTLTRSGLFETPSEDEVGNDSSDGVDVDGQSSAHFGPTDMVGRLEPSELRWIASSPAAREFLGRTIQELREMSFLQVVAPADRELADRQLQAALEKGEAHGLIYRIRTASGEQKAVEVNAGVRYATDGTVTYLRCHFTDVTAQLNARREERRRTRELERLNEELRRTNRALAELKDRYSDLYQNAPAMYFSLDAQGRFLVCNDTLLRVLGYRRRDLLGRSYATLLPEESRPMFDERFRLFLKEGSIEVESRWLRADGQLIDVLIKGTAVRDEQGRLLHSRSVAQDITALKRLAAELERNNQQLALANEELSIKNKELDEFTYVVSHDLQEPLRTLIAFSDFLRQDYKDRLEGEGLEFLGYLTDASKRMRALIQDLLNLSRAGKVTKEFRAVELASVLQTLRADLAELIRSKGAELRIADDLPTVWGDRDRLGQLFSNLISNGLKYNQSARPEVEVGVRPGNDLAGQPAGQVCLYVRDNGIGIDPKFHIKVFQIFRRLHPREHYEGTGAGLAICQKIIQAHGGRIWVESQPGKGATFCLTLPLPPVDADIGTKTRTGNDPESTASLSQDSTHAP